MNNAPTIVRLIRFPSSLRLVRKGKQFIGPLRRSGPVVLSEQHEPIDVTFRVSLPGVSFLTGGTTITVTEAFNEGEQRDVLLPWQLVVEADSRINQLILEIDVAYTGTEHLHTATVPLKLTYGVSRQRATAVAAGTALAAAAVAAVVSSRKKKKREDVEEVAVYNVPAAPRPRKKAKGKVTVREVPKSTKAASSKKTSKKAASKKAATKKAATKKASTKKAPAKKASSKKAGGTRRGSAASRSTRRTGGRGSSGARKSSARRSTRKSR